MEIKEITNLTRKVKELTIKDYYINYTSIDDAEKIMYQVYDHQKKISGWKTCAGYSKTRDFYGLNNSRARFC